MIENEVKPAEVSAVCSERRREAQGLSVVLDACAAVFLNEPNDKVVGDVQSVACALGENVFDDIVVDEALVQAFHDRMLVPVSPLFVPLQESCIVGSYLDESNAMHYASVESNRLDHVAGCYRAVGFDGDSLQGSPIALANLRADSLAVELAFLGYMKRQEAAAEDEGQAAHWHELAARFATEHIGVWVEKAAACLERSENDLYARTCLLAAQAVDAIRKADAVS